MHKVLMICLPIWERLWAAFEIVKGTAEVDCRAEGWLCIQGLAL